MISAAHALPRSVWNLPASPHHFHQYLISIQNVLTSTVRACFSAYAFFYVVNYSDESSNSTYDEHENFD